MCESYNVIKLATWLLLKLHPYVDAKTRIPPQKNYFLFLLEPVGRLFLQPTRRKVQKLRSQRGSSDSSLVLLRSTSTHRCQSAAENNPRPIAIMWCNQQTLTCSDVWDFVLWEREASRLSGLDLCNQASRGLTTDWDRCCLDAGRGILCSWFLQSFVQHSYSASIFLHHPFL